MLLAPAETPDKIKITLPEDDAKLLYARVYGGRLAVAGVMLSRDTAALVAQAVTGRQTKSRNTSKVAAAAVREGVIDPSDDTHSFEWDIPTIRSVRTHILYAALEDRAVSGRLAVEERPDCPAMRIYDDLWEAEHTLRREYEEATGEPYPMPDIDVIVGPKTY
jgi:hypothetical protein